LRRPRDFSDPSQHEPRGHGRTARTGAEVRLQCVVVLAARLWFHRLCGRFLEHGSGGEWGQRHGSEPSLPGRRLRQRLHVSGFCHACVADGDQRRFDRSSLQRRLGSARGCEVGRSGLRGECGGAPGLVAWLQRGGEPWSGFGGETSQRSQCRWRGSATEYL